MKHLYFSFFLILSLSFSYSQELQQVKCKGVYTEHLTSTPTADYLVSRSGVNSIILQKVSHLGDVQKCELANGLNKKCIGVFIREEQIYSVIYYKKSHKVIVETYDFELDKKDQVIEIGDFHPKKETLNVADRVYFQTSKDGFIIVRDDSKKTQNEFTSLSYLFYENKSLLKSISFETSKPLHVKDFKADDQLNILFILESEIPIDGFKNEAALDNYQSYLIVKPFNQEFQQKELSVKRSVRSFNAVFENDEIYIAGIKYMEQSQILEGYAVSRLNIQSLEGIETTFIPHENYSLETEWAYESEKMASSYEEAQNDTEITEEQKLRDICVLDLMVVDSNNILLVCYEHSKTLVGDGSVSGSSSAPCFRDYQFSQLNLENKNVKWWTKISNYEVNTIAGPYTTTDPFRTWGYKSGFLIKHKGLFPLNSNPPSFLLADTKNHYSSDGVHIDDHDIGKSMVARPVTSLLKIDRDSGNLTIDCLMNQNTKKIKGGFYSIIERSFIKANLAYIPYQHSVSLKLMFLKVKVLK